MFSWNIASVTIWSRFSEKKAQAATKLRRVQGIFRDGVNGTTFSWDMRMQPKRYDTFPNYYLDGEKVTTFS